MGSTAITCLIMEDLGQNMARRSQAAQLQETENQGDLSQ